MSENFLAGGHAVYVHDEIVLSSTREETANVTIRKVSTSPLLDNCLLVPYCLSEWTQPPSRREHHRFFAANVARKYTDTQTRKRQCSLEEGTSFGGDADFI